MTEASGICSALFRRIGTGTLEMRVHSVFDRAMNFSTGAGLVSLLSPGRCLQPYGILLDRDLDFHVFAREGRFQISREGIWKGEEPAICFSKASIEDLRYDGTLFSGSFQSVRALSLIRGFLSHHTEKGLVGLIFEGYDSIYTRYLSPRLFGFREAAKTGSDTEFADAAYEIAGCGQGLTPSSDDLLTGYFLCAVSWRGRNAVQAAADRAARRTNDISGAFLASAGEGLYSEDILSLVRVLKADGSAEAVSAALDRVASFGSSSGCDFLTGLYFGILDYMAGKEAM